MTYVWVRAAHGRLAHLVPDASVDGQRFRIAYGPARCGYRPASDWLNLAGPNRPRCPGCEAAA